MVFLFYQTLKIFKMRKFIKVFMSNFLIVELAVLAFYISCLAYIIKKDKKMIFFFLSTTVYAIIFENLNILLSFGKEGSYYYNKNFKLFFFEVPFFVVFAWSIIMYTSLKMAKALKIVEKSLPFIASLLVLLIDLAIDVVAIRLGYWVWVGYRFDEGYFGVPANNFIGWLLVSFSFFYLDKKIKVKTNWLKYVLLPVISYLMFLAMFMPLIALDSVLLLDKMQEFFVFIVIFVVFIFSIKIGERKDKVDGFIYAMRFVFYLFGIYFIIAEKMYVENILLLLTSIMFMLIEIALIIGEKCVLARENFE